MGHESRIELWLPLTTVLLVSFRADWLRREEAMKTAERENRNRWADMFSVCANGTAVQNRPCSSTWGWKQEKLQRWGRYFLLTSPSIERLTSQGHCGCTKRAATYREATTPCGRIQHAQCNACALPFCFKSSDAFYATEKLIPWLVARNGAPNRDKYGCPSMISL